MKLKANSSEDSQPVKKFFWGVGFAEESNLESKRRSVFRETCWPYIKAQIGTNFSLCTRYMLHENLAEDPDYQGKVWRGFAGDAAQAYLAFNLPYFKLLVGRERLAGDHSISITFGPSLANEVSEFVRREPRSASEQRQMVEKPREPISGHAIGLASDTRILEFELLSTVEHVLLKGDESVVFLLRPQVDFEASEWRLYICGSEPSGWNEYQMEPCLLKMIKGQGVPGFGVLWNLRLNHKEVKRGKYLYALVLVDRDGQRWHSAWRSFRVK